VNIYKPFMINQIEFMVCLTQELLKSPRYHADDRRMFPMVSGMSGLDDESYLMLPKIAKEAKDAEI
jgi:hypothetical protein